MTFIKGMCSSISTTFDTPFYLGGPAAVVWCWYAGFYIIAFVYEHIRVGFLALVCALRWVAQLQRLSLHIQPVEACIWVSSVIVSM